MRNKHILSSMFNINALDFSKITFDDLKTLIQWASERGKVFWNNPL